MEDAELATLVEQANIIILNASLGWWKPQRLIEELSTVFGIEPTETAVRAVVDAALTIDVGRHRIKAWLCLLVNPLFNYCEVASKTTLRALGFAYIELCRAVKLGELDVSELASDKGLQLLRTEFKRRLKKPRSR